MRRGELGESLGLEVELIDEGRPNRSGVPIRPEYLTIHNTSNTGSRADAKAHSKWVRKTGYYILRSGKKNWVSWHYTVDDMRVIQQLPASEKGWHAGKGNGVSLGIEICMHKEISQKAAYDRAARLCACLLYDFSLSVDAVVTHKHWTGKNCPVLLLKGNRWDKFRTSIEHYLNNITTESESTTETEEELAPIECTVKCDESYG
ncbi:peptidoglycan recognition protein family protein [Microbulbifer epialgicus]|uniref:N-acetylmuramoyl-L-alanine amidase n=1 Tax=Microbulbifer epialgicus TaxID=393907 RepID=A0ABV4P3B8_9GAMM